MPLFGSLGQVDMMQSVSWQYKDDSGYFVSYSFSESIKIERMYRAGDTSQCLVTFRRRYRLDFTQMRQVNMATGFMRPIRRHLESDDETVAQNSGGTGEQVRWQCKTDSGLFLTYSASKSAKIEAMFQSNDRSQCQMIEIGGKVTMCRYDFRRMKLVSIMTGVERDIQRRVLGRQPACCSTKILYSPAVHALLAEINDVARKYSVKYVFDDSIAGKVNKWVKLEGENSLSMLYAFTEIKSLVINFDAFNRKNPHYPPQWGSMEGKQVKIVDLEMDLSECGEVCSKLLKTLDRQIVRVQRVQNQWLWERYRRASMHLYKKNTGEVNEKELFHGTSREPATTICSSKQGFDVRFSREGLWGHANYFAVNASYSHDYSHYDGDHHEMILAKVLTGDSYQSKSDSSLRMPPVKKHLSEDGQIQQVRYDSVTGHTRGSQVYMTYSNELAYPAYIITYTTHKHPPDIGK